MTQATTPPPGWGGGAPSPAQPQQPAPGAAPEGWGPAPPQGWGPHAGPTAAPTAQPLPAVSNLITRYSNADANLDRLGRVVSGVESSGGRNPAISHAGAHGVMQIMPDTAKMYGFDPTRLDDPAYNVHVGMTILSDLLKRAGGDPIKAAIAYNAGLSKMNTPLDQLPKETQDYVRKMQAAFQPHNAPAQAPKAAATPSPPAGWTAPAGAGATNPMDEPGQSNLPPLATGEQTTSFMRTLAGHQDLPFILLNAQQRDDATMPHPAKQTGQGGQPMSSQEQQTHGLIELLQNPKSEVRKAWDLYKTNPAAAIDEYGAGSPKQNTFMGNLGDPTAKFMETHPKTNAAVSLIEELFNPMAWAEGAVAGRAFGLIGKTPMARAVGDAMAPHGGLGGPLGFGSPLAEIAKRGGVDSEQWAKGLIASVKKEDADSDKLMQKILGGISSPAQWEVVRLSQGLKPNPEFMGQYQDLVKRAAALRADIKHVTAEQVRTKLLDPTKGDVHNVEKYFPMSNTHDFGESWELEQQLRGNPAGGSGVTATQSKVFQNVDESRAAKSWDPNASAAENYQTWRRQRMQGVAFEDALTRAPGSLRRDIAPGDYVQGKGQPTGERTVEQPWQQNATETPGEALERVVKQNNAHYPSPDHPMHISMREQSDYVAAKKILQNIKSPAMQKSMIAPELWNFFKKSGPFSKYVDSGGSYLPGEEETWAGRLVGLMRASIISNFVYHPMVNVAGNDAAMRGMAKLGGPVFEQGGYAYNAAKAAALQVGLVKPEQFVGGAQEYADWQDRALKAGGLAEFGVSKKTALGGDRARLMSSPVEDKMWTEYESRNATMVKRLDKALTSFGDFNRERTFGQRGEEAYAVSLFKDAVQRGGLSDPEAGKLVRNALGDYYNFDPHSPWSIGFLFMPWLKSNTKLWTSVLVKRPQYLTAPTSAIHDYNEQTGDPALSAPFAPSDYAIHMGAPGENAHIQPPFVFRDMARMADAAGGNVEEKLYQGEALARSRANPFMVLFMDVGHTADAAADMHSMKGPENDYRVLFNPKAPQAEQYKELAGNLAARMIPMPFVQYAVQDAVRRGWAPSDLAHALVSAAGGGYISEGATEQQRHDVGRAQHAFLKMFAKGNKPSEEELQQGWDYYRTALQAAGVLR